MKKRILFLTIIIGVIVIVTSLSFIFLKPDNSYSGLLIKAVSSADRIEIQTSGYWHPESGKLLYEINGQRKVKELLKLIKFDEGKFRSPCSCDGDYWIAFLKGKEELASLEFHESDRLRWRYGKWPGDINLTKESCESVRNWLKAQGFNFKYIPDEYLVN